MKETLKEIIRKFFPEAKFNMDGGDQTTVMYEKNGNNFEKVINLLGTIAKNPKINDKGIHSESLNYFKNNPKKIKSVSCTIFDENNQIWIGVGHDGYVGGPIYGTPEEDTFIFFLK